MALIKHRERTPEVARSSSFGLPAWRRFDELFPAWRWFDDLFRDADGHQLIKVEEFTEDHTFVVRAELPGIDPDKDVEITVADGMLHITAERSEEEEKTDRSFYRRELRYGSFARTVALPDGIDESGVQATYKDGILEVRVPLPADLPKEESRRVPVTRG